MIIASKEYVVKRLTELMITPKKHFSQNFLTDYDVVKKTVDALDIDKDDLVIEIGPGLGALTQEILFRGVNVDAYEIDINMVNHLNEFFKNENKLNVYNIDFMKVDLNKYKGKKIKFISNIPYNLTTPIIEKIVTSNLDIESFEFMVQKEVYDRIKAKVGTKDYSPLNIFIECVGKLEVIQKVPAKSFIPVPNVDSIVLKISFINEIDKDINFIKTFINVTKASFLFRRKTILNNMISYLHNKDKAIEVLKESGINELTRPDAITLNQYLELAKVIYRLK